MTSKKACPTEWKTQIFFFWWTHVGMLIFFSMVRLLDHSFQLLRKWASGMNQADEYVRRMTWIRMWLCNIPGKIHFELRKGFKVVVVVCGYGKSQGKESQCTDIDECWMNIKLYNEIYLINLRSVARWYVFALRDAFAHLCKYTVRHFKLLI